MLVIVLCEPGHITSFLCISDFSLIQQNSQCFEASLSHYTDRLGMVPGGVNICSCVWALRSALFSLCMPLSMSSSVACLFQLISLQSLPRMFYSSRILTTVLFFPTQGLCYQYCCNKCLLFEIIKATKDGIYLLFRHVFLSEVYEFYY